MTPIKYRKACLPTRQQELLLRAALLRGKDAIEAWHEWKAIVEIDKLDLGSHRLLPQLYRNLDIQGVKDPLMQKFKGVYRHTWYKNRVLIQHVAALLRSLHHHGIEVLILKGLALVTLYYKDYGLRPMKDCDILVHREQVPSAIDVLKKLGWTPKFKSPEALIPFRHASEFKDLAGRQLDLHWNVFWEYCQANADDDFWDGALLTKIDDVPTYALNPTDQLLHVCAHGAVWNVVPPFRWAADAMMIMGSSKTEIDWSRLIRKAEKRSLILPLRDTLNYLQDRLGAPVPPAILERLQALRTSKMERFEYQAKTRPAKGIRGLLVHWLTYSRMASNSGLGHKLIEFPRYLQYTWDIEQRWQVPFYLILRRIRRVLRTTVVI